MFAKNSHPLDNIVLKVKAKTLHPITVEGNMMPTKTITSSILCNFYLHFL